MSKNQKYKRQFLIEIEGISTNEFMPSVIVELLNSVVDAINTYKQSTATIKEITDDNPA
jgi:hypothetical protein